ncbi:hypothetical protein IW140_005404 [Coemansia sp. RSA 1813]|nr:hypothetical protein EV178_005478 [Coemansia sp. RSA 1646]KAJ1769013.1 hypothetical protein LPJ74_004377 [Coemansia sp. RSA 1843]KAJ2086641.1 hypothetical protein IW138_005512 [Coemansia sp. RSA 986]KAJ2211430.1 hypothetical protein EV179_005472 [Coemansia sp. RSA 487]KAJ2565291.1 hypothetical protein IW140_005404 [Coemansia sp. RSA 1813]
MSSGKQSIRRLDYGAENEDLERMQQEFLSGETKPAAKVVRISKPPTVSSNPVVVSNADTKTYEKSSVLSNGEKHSSDRSDSDMLDFAKSMTQAIKEFQIRERNVSKDASSEDRQNINVQQDDSDNLTSGIRPNSKKPSLFAQRRLEMQHKQAAIGAIKVAGQSAPAPSNESNYTAATVLPKLMAPVPEHTVVGPVCAPTMKPRETGFPQIPVDYTASDSSVDVYPNAPLDVKSTEYWDQVRHQVSQENDDKIRAMSDAEILEAQSDIRSMISNGAIERLMQRKQKNSTRTNDRVAESVQNSKGIDNTVESSAADKENTTKQIRGVQFADSVKVAKYTDISSSSDSESDEDSSALPPPPPAEWVNEGIIDVDNNTIGADSEFYSEMKRKYFPTEVVEEAKLAWILGHKQSKSPMEKAILEGRKKDAAAVAAAAKAADIEEVELLSKPISHVRFAFDGHIISEEAASEIPTTAGLHHHGDDPEKPGYTIPELLHLSRSTVPMQRVVALGALKCIFHNINVGTWDIAQSMEVYLCLLDWEAELYLAGAISDANMTQRVVATGALWTFVVEMAKYKALVRLANGGQMEADDDVKKPGSAIHGMVPQPAVAKGKLVERTFKALDNMLTARFMDSVYEVISLSMLPERHLSMLAECVKQLQEVSGDLEKRIADHGKLPLLLENKFPYLMNKQ